MGIGDMKLLVELLDLRQGRRAGVAILVPKGGEEVERHLDLREGGEKEKRAPASRHGQDLHLSTVPFK